MDYKVFIGYSSEDNDKAQYVHGCLANIVEFKPYKAERYPVVGENFKQRIQWHLQESFVMVVLLTESGKNSQWVNQEIGYAYALKTRPQKQYQNLPHIIPISHKQVKLKGFITKDTIDFLFLDDYARFGTAAFAYIVTDIIAQIRLRIPRGLEEKVLHLRITCSNCVDKKGFPHEYSEPLPAHEDLEKAIRSNKYVMHHTCPRCKAKNLIDGRTFLPYNVAET